MLQAESRSPDANITTGQEALWWALVTITTVGYGDFFPVTGPGRLIATFVMFAGVGIIGALASILASILVPPPKEQDPKVIEAEAAAAAAEADTAAQNAQAAAEASDAVTAELRRMREELAELRKAVAADRARRPDD